MSRGYVVSIVHDTDCRIVSATHDHGDLVAMTVTALEAATLLACPACDTLVRVEASTAAPEGGVPR